mmetsp:Transcript_51994/g.123782  ORF Transcript_51994/g.123782 Transcript_51994/m.123782 type:complete len:280 (+) Transcript_51994:103-942(+)
MPSRRSISVVALVALRFTSVLGMRVGSDANARPADEAELAPEESVTSLDQSQLIMSENSMWLDPMLVNHSTFCSKLGGECECPGGFVLLGKFSSKSKPPKFVVYPKRVENSLSCRRAILGNPLGTATWSGEECRCIQHDEVQCVQDSLPTVNGCGSGASATVLNKAMTAAQVSCCNAHDLCYGTCNHTKESCDMDLSDCLYASCSGSLCKAKVWTMVRSIMTFVGENAFASTQNTRENYTLISSDTQDGIDDVPVDDDETIEELEHLTENETDNETETA